MDNIKITIFTPTYNRAHMIHNLYNSLQNQTCKNFEWLIVDDGSTDNTEGLVMSWLNKPENFPIRYYKKSNGGKCSAINFALDLANGELFLVIDSDDILTSDAVQKVIELESTIENKSEFCGVAFNLGSAANVTPNKIFNNKYKDASLLKRYTEFDGERAFAFYTDVHKKYKYPIFKNEKFMTEAVVWNRIADDGYLMRFSNDIICIYEYHDDGLTKAGNSIFVNNPHGYGLWLKEKDKFLKKGLLDKLKTYYTFTCELKNRHSDSLIAECIDVSVILIKVLKCIHKIITSMRK